MKISLSAKIWAENFFPANRRSLCQERQAKVTKVPVRSGTKYYEIPLICCEKIYHLFMVKVVENLRLGYHAPFFEGT
jgi:hypothetical protein